MESGQKFNLTRRKMIRIIGWMVFIPLAGIWDLMVVRIQERKIGSTIRIPYNNIPQGVSYYNGFYIIRKDNEIRACSTRCTHLGCQVRSTEDGFLTCPCHGSVFNVENGDVVKGPADKPLNKLKTTFEKDELIIFY